MFRVALKDLLARKRRLVTTGLAVMLGIAFLSGTQVLSAVLRDSIDALVSDIYDSYDAVIRSPQVQDLGFGQELRAAVDDEAVGVAEQVDGVTSATGVVEAVTVQLVGADGKVFGSDVGPPTVVFSWIDGELQPGILTEGHEPRADDEIALDFSTAEDAGYAVGDTVRVVTSEGTEDFTLVGTVGLGSDGTRSTGAHILGFVIPVAQRLAQTPDQFTYVAVAGEDGIDQSELAQRLADVLPDLQILTGEQFIDENADSIAAFVDILSTFVSIFGYVALFVACFIIYNTFSILVAQRTRETALLRAIGASRRQVLLATLAEAAIVGLIASLVGLLGGATLATLLKGIVGQIFTVEPGLPSLPVGAFVVALVVGLTITMASATVPALRSSKVPPVAAMSEVAIDRASVSRSRVLWGSAFLVIGAGLFALGLADTGPNPLAEFGLGAALILIAVAIVLGPIIAAPVSRVLARPFSRRGVTARLAGENAARNPKRTAATAAALTIGVTLVTLIAIIASSVRSSVDAAIDELVTADFIVSASSFSFVSGIPAGAAEEMRALDDVELVSPVRFSPFRLLDELAKKSASETAEQDPSRVPTGMADDAPDGQDDFAIGIDPATFFRVANGGEMNGSPEDMGPGTIATLDRIAEERGWSIGDAIPVYFAQTGVQDLELAVTFKEDVGQGNYFIPIETLTENALPMFDNDVALYVQAADDVTPAGIEELRGELEALVEDSPSVKVQDLQEYAESQTGPLDTFLAIVYGLLGLAIVIALIGIANTLTLSVLERTKEIGLLRAVGMSRRQLRRTIVGESVIISLFGTLLGLIVGIVFSLALSVVIAADSPGLFRYNLPVVQLVVITVVAALAGVLAAVLPAWRASRLDVLDAVSSV